jgi:hypothetical protein
LKLFRLLSLNYYSIALLLICTVAALVISIVHYRRHRRLRIFTYYIIFSLLQDSTALFFMLTLPMDRRPAVGVLVTILTVSYGFLFFEFITYNLFILQYINSRLWRRVVRINAWTFFVLLLSGFTGISKYLFRNPLYYFLLETISLVPPCLIYFYQLFRTGDPEPLRNQPAFWVITGLLSLKACSIPLLLTVQLMIGYENAVYSLNYILYTVLFVLLIRAYLCPPPKSQPPARGNSTLVSG